MRNWKRKERSSTEIRKVTITKNFCPASDGSVLISMGNTWVICAASISRDVPDHARDKELGWISAEYTMLPYSTNPRTPRKDLRPDGRSVEIQRLIGRSLRSITDLNEMKDFMITLDCDVLQADGGTRTAAITGSYVALRIAVNNLLEKDLLARDPIKAQIAAISTGYIDGALLLDLEYSEDSIASVDMNIVMDSNMNFVEIQGTGETVSFSKNQLDDMLSLAKDGIVNLFSIQKEFIENQINDAKNSL